MSREKVGVALVVGCVMELLGYALGFGLLATIAMLPIHHAISTGLLMSGKDPQFSWGAAWCIGLFPPCLPISIVACIALFIIGLFV